jgi:hypothetical protein
VVARVERAAQARHRLPAESELFVDAAALNLQDFYTGLERIFSYVASNVDQSVPSGPEWHRELFRQMNVPVPNVRPEVIPSEIAADVDEYLRFRHVVRHIYTFDLDPVRVEDLASRLRPTFDAVSSSLLALATLLERLAHEC